MTDYLPTAPDVLTVQEAADLLKMSVTTLTEFIEGGQLEAVILNEKVLIFKIFLLKFIEKHHKICYTKEVENHENFKDKHLENRIEPDFAPSSEGDTEIAKKINQPVVINGVKRWITAGSMQEFTDKVVKLMGAPLEPGKYLFADYALNWFETYSKPNVETATATTYKRQLSLHLLPAFDGLNVEDITTDHVQRLFNGMTGAKATKDKARMVLNQIMDAAVEDKLISSNPVKSRRVKISGNASRATTPYSVEQMRYLVQHIGDIKSPSDRMYLALQALHPLRLEEVLGLKGEDVDTRGCAVHIRRAVTHPTRNQPEIKDTKTESSHRTVGLSSLALPYIVETPADKFIFGGDKPLSYTQVRKMCDRIKRDTGFSENITPLRFRTTVLTDLYDQTKDIKLAQAAAGHTTPAMTLKYYVKGRETSSSATAAVERAYS